MKQRKTFSQWICSALIIALVLGGCAGQPPVTNTPTPNVLEETAPSISASGEVVPAQWTTLSFAQAGNLVELSVKEGEAIKAGDVIARLSVPELQANLAQKQAAVKVAEASLAQLTAPPRQEDLRAAEEAVAVAQARMAEATAQRDLLYTAVTQADILQAETQVYAIQTQKDKLDEAMQKIIKRGGFALAAGEAVGNQQKYAELELAAAQQVLDDLLAGPTADQRRIAEARIGVAGAQVKVAQARVDLVEAGATAEDKAIAQVKIDQAKAEAALLEAQLAQTQIAAPYDGVVAKVLIDAHQFVGPGVPIVQVADLTSLRVETNDLSETDAARINLGATTRVRFDALPDSPITGKVVRIDPKAKDGAGVNYTTAIQLDQLPDALRWGMTANVEIEASPPVLAKGSTAPANDRRISATGKALPAHKALLSAALPGQVVELLVEVGTPVKQGDVIARLATSVLDAEVAKAEAGLALAQANLDRVKAAPRPELILEARSALSATQAAVTQAAANRDQVKQGATQAEIDRAQAAVQQAYIEMVEARTKRDVLAGDHARDKATRQQVDDATELYVILNREYEAAQLRLEKLRAGAEPAAVRAAQAGVSAGSAELAAQQAQLDRLLAGATREDIAVLEASVAQAQAGLDRAQAVRQQAEIVAPFDGTISEVLIRGGQYVNAGQPIVLLGDLSGLRIETTDLNEKDIAGLKLGDQVVVTIDALPGVQVEGTIAQIAPKSSKTTGVNYMVTIELAEIPEGLRWGMTALVELASQ
ncbi:Inner membrane protein YiaV [Thermoflexales bacterium]|nr:Inner membrane protein YiaV [Thermoflexales bacterium]